MDKNTVAIGVKYTYPWHDDLYEMFVIPKSMLSDNFIDIFESFPDAEEDLSQWSNEHSNIKSLVNAKLLAPKEITEGQYNTLKYKTFIEHQ